MINTSMIKRIAIKYCMERSTMKITPIFIVLFFVVLFASEVKGQALDFDGIDDYASASGGLANNSNFTLEAWVKPRSFSSYNWVIQVGDVALGASSSGYLTYLVDGSTSGSVSTQLIPLNTWSHIALVYNSSSGNKYTLYYNGSALAVTPQFSYADKFPDNLGGFYFSRNAGSEGWTGGIDEVRIWGVARTSAEILANCNAELTNPTGQTGLAGYYQMNEGTPSGNNTPITLLGDASGYGHPAALTGFAMTGATSNYVVHTFGALCTNPTNGGTIGPAQTLATGSTPSVLTQTVAPAGTPVGTLQYKWQSSTTSAAAGFADISGATSSGYQAGALSQTTWYKRLVKVDCESTWLESNVMEITVVAAVTWTGSTSTDWNTAGNWNPAVVPTSAVDATIPANLTNYPVVASGTNAQVKNLTHNGALDKRITVNTGGKLTVNGSYAAANGAEIKILTNN